MNDRVGANKKCRAEIQGGRKEEGDDENDYDCVSGHVIVANNEQEVRNIAMKVAGDEGREIWNTTKLIKVGNYTGTKTNPFILLTDFYHG